MSFVKSLECSRCGRSVSHRELQNLCPKCQSPLLVRYDLERVRGEMEKEDLPGRPLDIWRYLEVMPVDTRSEVITLGEGFTPILPLRRLGEQYDLRRLYLKDEGTNPTGSFKARGLSAAVTMAAKLGAAHLCIPTAGNAGGALAAYSAKAGLPASIFMPADTPLANVVEAEVTGADVTLVDGLITEAGARMGRRREEEGWFDVSTLKEPYRIEGKKSMGYELAEQLHWKLPDVILYPTGGGTGLIGMWKAFSEMEELGWINGRRPRLVSVQSDGCAPIVKAFEEGGEVTEMWPDASTFAAGIRVPKALGDFLILAAIRASKGCAVAVSDLEIFEAVMEVGGREGLFLCPEGAACWAALKKLRSQKWVDRDEEVVIFNTGAGHKYIDALRKFEQDRR
ncbi:MAG: threonine synthase [Acidobacteriota bacterium]